MANQTSTDLGAIQRKQDNSASAQSWPDLGAVWPQPSGGGGPSGTLPPLRRRPLLGVGL